MKSTCTWGVEHYWYTVVNQWSVCDICKLLLQNLTWITQLHEPVRAHLSQAAPPQVNSLPLENTENLFCKTRKQRFIYLKTVCMKNIRWAALLSSLLVFAQLSFLLSRRGKTLHLLPNSNPSVIVAKHDGKSIVTDRPLFYFFFAIWAFMLIMLDANWQGSCRETGDGETDPFSTKKNLMLVWCWCQCLADSAAMPPWNQFAFPLVRTHARERWLHFDS